MLQPRVLELLLGHARQTQLRLLQRLLQRAGAYDGPINGTLGPGMAGALRRVKDLPFAPTPGGDVPKERFDATTIPVNAPLPRR